MRPRFKHLHEKHKALFAADVDTTMKNFAVGVKNMQSQRMSALLIDVEAALKEEDEPNLEFPTGPAAGGDQNMDDAGSEDHGNGNWDVDVESIDKGEKDEEADPQMGDAGSEDPDAAAEKVDEVHASSRATTDVPQAAVILDSSTIVGGDAAEVKYMLH